MKLTGRIAYTGIILACLIFLMQATPLLHTRWVEDESWYGSVAYTLLTEGHLRNPVFPDADIESHVDTRPPGLVITLATATKVLGIGPRQLRFPSVLAGLGLVLAVFLLGAELLNRTAGVLAALLVATDNFLFMAARTARQDAFVAFFSVLAVWLFFRSRRTGSLWLTLASGLSIGVAMNYHPNAVGIAASIGLLLLWEYRFRIFQTRRVWVFGLGIVLAVLPFTLWIVTSQMRIDAFRKLWGRGAATTAAMFLSAEQSRYSDFIGIGSSRIPLPVNVPARLHIAAAILVAAILLIRRRRDLLGWLVILIVPSLLLWSTELNPTSRFFVIVAPYLSILLIAGATEFATTPRRERLAMAVLLVIALTQAAGNSFILLRSRSADYQTLTDGLRRLIPPGAQTFGALTFWLSFYDRPYYSYSRTPLPYALAHGATYLIMNDRVLLHGTGYYGINFDSVRDEMNTFARDHCQLRGRVPSGFYGDLEVYQVLDPSQYRAASAPHGSRE
jgi:4-amino-4-deoxy-L-arabinose transferase-like glycosyltransferase